jgi:methyl coenzyme M reductase beta subunit
MASEHVYNTCIYATGGDEHYCRQVVNTLTKLSRERAVAYTSKHNVRHVVMLSDDDEPVVDIMAGKDKSLIVRIKSQRYVALIRYVYDGQLKPVHAVVSNLEIVNMMNMHLFFTEILNEIFSRMGDYDKRLHQPARSG